MITDWSTKTLTVDGITYTMNNLQRVDTTLTANTPTKTPVLTDVNTVFTDTGNIHVEYRKKSTATSIETDIIAPTPDWTSLVLSSGGSNVIVAGNAGQLLSIPLPDGFGGYADHRDRLYVADGKAWLEKWMDTPDPTKPLSAQVLSFAANPVDISDTPTGQILLVAKTYPHYTHVYSDAADSVKPTINATIKEASL